MREKEDMRGKRLCTKKKKESKKVFAKRKKLACYEHRNHVYRFIEKYEYAAK